MCSNHCSRINWHDTLRVGVNVMWMMSTAVSLSNMMPMMSTVEQTTSTLMISVTLSRATNGLI